MKFKNPFKRKRKYASPYYGGSGALYKPSAMPLRKVEEEEKKEEPRYIDIMAKQEEAIATKEKERALWEQRRFELVKMLVGQDRRSVVLGKLRASDKQIAEKARRLADAALAEMMNHPFNSHGGEREEDDERGS